MSLASQRSPRVWRTLKCSVQGASHAVRQDRCEVRGDGTDGVVAAVADGHGGKKYFRSDEGARIAVDVALATAQQGLDDGRCTPEWVKALPEDIAKLWCIQVNAHAEEHPFTAEEEPLLGQPVGITVELQRLVPYGTTLLLAVLGPGFLACVQLGDGDILALSDDGAIERPIPIDPSLIANETHSLVSFHEDRQAAKGGPVLRHEPWRLARVSFHDTGPLAAPRLLLLASDGYGNSFRDPAGLERAATDYAVAIHSRGIPAVEAEMEAWLQETTAGGSGDDISVVIVFNAALAASAAPVEAGDGVAAPGAEAVADDGEPEVQG